MFRKFLKPLSPSALPSCRPDVISAVLASLSARSFPLTPACPGRWIRRSLCSRRLCMAVCLSGQPIQASQPVQALNLQRLVPGRQPLPYQSSMSLPLACHCRWHVTADGMSLPMAWHVTADGMSLPMACHCRWHVTADGMSLPMACHYRWHGMSLPMACHCRWHVTTDGMSLPMAWHVTADGMACHCRWQAAAGVPKFYVTADDRRRSEMKICGSERDRNQRPSRYCGGSGAGSDTPSVSQHPAPHAKP